MAIIKQLRNKLLGNIYPITKFNAVYDDNGNKLSDSIIITDDTVQATDTVKLNADLLCGKPGEEYALKEDIIYETFPSMTVAVTAGNVKSYLISNSGKKGCKIVGITFTKQNSLYAQITPYVTDTDPEAVNLIIYPQATFTLIVDVLITYRKI